MEGGRWAGSLFFWDRDDVKHRETKLSERELSNTFLRVSRAPLANTWHNVSALIKSLTKKKTKNGKGLTLYDELSPAYLNSIKFSISTRFVFASLRKNKNPNFSHHPRNLNFVNLEISYGFITFCAKRVKTRIDPCWAPFSLHQGKQNFSPRRKKSQQ